MQCANHPGVEPEGRCVQCGLLLCRECMVELDRIYCSTCAPESGQEEMPSAPEASASPREEPIEPVRAPLADTDALPVDSALPEAVPPGERHSAGAPEAGEEVEAEEKPLPVSEFPEESPYQESPTEDTDADPAGRIRPGRAYSFMLDDPDWLQKCALGALMTLLSIFVVPFLMVMGYMFEVMKITMSGVEHRLPTWEMTGERLREGALFVLLSIIYSIPFFVFLAGTAVVGTLTGGATGPGQFFALILFLLGWLCTIAMLGFVMILAPAAAQLFAITGSFGAALDFKKVFKLVERNFRQRAVALGITIATFWFLVPLGLLVCGIGIFATLFYSLLVVWRLYGDIARLEMLDPEFVNEITSPREAV